jgi:hypothetical protein
MPEEKSSRSEAAVVATGIAMGESPRWHGGKRLLLRSGPLTRRFGDELVEQVISGHRLEPGRGRSD